VACDRNAAFGDGFSQESKSWASRVWHYSSGGCRSGAGGGDFAGDIAERGNDLRSDIDRFAPTLGCGV